MDPQSSPKVYLDNKQGAVLDPSCIPPSEPSISPEPPVSPESPVSPEPTISPELNTSHDNIVSAIEGLNIDEGTVTGKQHLKCEDELVHSADKSALDTTIEKLIGVLSKYKLVLADVGVSEDQVMTGDFLFLAAAYIHKHVVIYHNFYACVYGTKKSIDSLVRSVICSPDETPVSSVTAMSIALALASKDKEQPCPLIIPYPKPKDPELASVHRERAVEMESNHSNYAATCMVNRTETAGIDEDAFPGSQNSAFESRLVFHNAKYLTITPEGYKLDNSTK